MYKPKTKTNLPSPLLAQRSSSPLTHHSRLQMENHNHNSAIDLRSFNDYLQQRIARSALRKELEMGRESSQRKQGQPVPPSELIPSKQFLKSHNLQNFKESRIKKSREQPAAPKQSWRKHESIEKLLNKENRYAEDDNRKTESESQQVLRDLERKYQELQEKYKMLMKETSQNAREFERDKRELNKLKELHQSDQAVLSDLKEELKRLQESVSFDGNKSSMLKVKSECNIPMASSKTYMGTNNWESNLNIESRPGTPSKVGRYRTSQNWTANMDKRALFQSEEKERPQQSRYYSRQKEYNHMSNSTKPKKGSGHTQYSNVQSKTSIKIPQSMRGSRVAGGKPMTETCIRLEGDKSATPTTLQKKMMNAKPYSKYRFQPSYKFQ